MSSSFSSFGKHFVYVQVCVLRTIIVYEKKNWNYEKNYKYVIYFDYIQFLSHYYNFIFIFNNCYFSSSAYTITSTL